MRDYCFSVDDNIKFLRDLTVGSFDSIFEHPYLAVYKDLHDRFGVKVQLNLFYKTGDFELSEMTDRYKTEWQANSHWLKMSFHGLEEEKTSYLNASYNEMYSEAGAVNNEIIRFAGKDSLAHTTTVHFCKSSSAGIEALRDLGYKCLLGLFGDEKHPSTSYGLTDIQSGVCRKGVLFTKNHMSYISIDAVINKLRKEEIVPELIKFMGRQSVRIMIHEQYFYTDYVNYQPDFKQKLEIAIAFLTDSGYTPAFTEEITF